MVGVHNNHRAFHLGSRTALPIPEPQLAPLNQFLNPSLFHLPTILRRSPDGSSSSSSPSSSCSSNDKSSQCQKPVDPSADITLPVVLGVVIPIAFAFIVFIFLHRRHVKRLRREDANDPHQSLDFGMDLPNSVRKSNKKGEPEMSVTDLATEKALRRGRGMSMDLGSPYILPPGLQGSRESLHSLSRTIHNGDDRYRPATMVVPGESPSLRYATSLKQSVDDSSSYTGSSGRGPTSEGMNQNLLRNAQRMSRSMPPTRRGSLSSPVIPQMQVPEPAAGIARQGSPSNVRNGGLAPASADTRDSYMTKDGADLRQSNNYLGPLIHSREPSTDLQAQNKKQVQQQPPAQSIPRQQIESRISPPIANTVNEGSRPPRSQSLAASAHPIHQDTFYDNESDYGEQFEITPPSPKLSPEPQQIHAAPRPSPVPKQATVDNDAGGLDSSGLGYDVRRLSMGVRPLPPEDPSDNPEQRANRIRSFYKEYFDDSKHGPAPARAPAAYYEDYNQEYVGDGAIFDPATGQFISTQPNPHYSEPLNRRAMTPPPRAPPRFQGPARHHATLSGGQLIPPGPRAFSSASGRFGPPGRGPPKKVLPPPSPLRILPTPHLLKEDSFFLPIDFAPPTSYKDRQAGRPGSPRGGMLPYSPLLPAHTPLASSFDDLSVMPSPHALRKSGTFTALDFAPPPRFANSPANSDAGSIRSNRSAMSANQLHNIRSGAYRISRIPKEVVGTKNELSDSLKPNWGNAQLGMRSPAV